MGLKTSPAALLISRPTLKQGSFNFLLLELFFFLNLSSLFLFFPFCPPKSGITEKGVNKKNFGKLFQPCSSWLMEWNGEGGPEHRNHKTLDSWIFKTKSGLEMETLVN